MDHDTDIRRRRDGSIDTDFYLMLGACARSEAAYRIVATVTGMLSQTRARTSAEEGPTRHASPPVATAPSR